MKTRALSNVLKLQRRPVGETGEGGVVHWAGLLNQTLLQRRPVGETGEGRPAVGTWAVRFIGAATETGRGDR